MRVAKIGVCFICVRGAAFMNLRIWVFRYFHGYKWQWRCHDCVDLGLRRSGALSMQEK